MSSALAQVCTSLCIPRVESSLPTRDGMIDRPLPNGLRIPSSQVLHSSSRWAHACLTVSSRVCKGFQEQAALTSPDFVAVDRGTEGKQCKVSVRAGSMFSLT